MRFKFNFHQVDPSLSLTEYTQAEIEKVARHLLTEGSCQVFFRMMRHECLVQLEVNSPWGHFRASGHSPDFYRSADDAVRKLGKQFLKHKDRHQDHSKPLLSKGGRLDRVNSALETIPLKEWEKKVG